MNELQQTRKTSETDSFPSTGQNYFHFIWNFKVISTFSFFKIVLGWKIFFCAIFWITIHVQIIFIFSICKASKSEHADYIGQNWLICWDLFNLKRDSIHSWEISFVHNQVGEAEHEWHKKLKIIIFDKHIWNTVYNVYLFLIGIHFFSSRWLPNKFAKQ